jgi:hypothetical protein
MRRDRWSADEIVVAIAGKAERLTLANDLEGHARLVRVLTRGQASARVCLEANGIYHLDFALALHRAPRIPSRITCEPTSSSPRPFSSSRSL